MIDDLNLTNTKKLLDVVNGRKPIVTTPFDHLCDIATTFIRMLLEQHVNDLKRVTDAKPR